MHSAMPLHGQQYATQRHRLCAWLEEERGKLAALEPAARAGRDAELDAEFRRRLDELYREARRPRRQAIRALTDGARAELRPPCTAV